LPSEEIAVDKEVGRKKRSRKILLSVGAVALVALAVVIAFQLGANRQPEPIVLEMSDQGGRGFVVTEDNVEEMLEQLNRPVEDGYYRTRMNVDWVFPSSSEPSTNAHVENADTNTRTVYFDLVLADTNELIYSSPFIPVGAKLENFTLDAHVPAGEHSGIVTYHLVDDDFQEISTVSVSVNLRIME